MSARWRCPMATAGQGISRDLPSSRWDRISKIAGWLFPATMLALIPKCPMCIAAYVALATGIGISMPAAVHLRVSMILVCVASLIFLAVRRIKLSRGTRAFGSV